jgi:hypothetical protein
VQELNALTVLARVYREEELSAVHHFTVKPIVHRTIAAKPAGVPVAINTLSGLGICSPVTFEPDAPAASVTRCCATSLSTVARVSSSRTGSMPRVYARFACLACRGSLISAELEPISSATDLATPTTRRPGRPLVLLGASLLRSKGVEDFVRCDAMR